MANDVCMYLIVLGILLLNALLGDGRQFGGSKGILKTIKTADGEVVDCVDIYKQPAFSHPLLKNHTIQLKPSFETNRVGSQGSMVQSWQNYGQCPQGSIPILREQGTQPPFLRNKFAPFSLKDDPKYKHQWAVASLNRKGGIQGVHAKINNWSPTVNPEGGSMSQIWMAAGGGDDLNSIELGWRVVPTLGYNDPRFFIYWTRDNYVNTGCYNLDCPGFVQTNPSTVIGGKYLNISAYAGIQFDIEYDVRKDSQTNNWWLTVNGSPQGYYPSTLFSNMNKYADILGWGGVAIDNINAYYDTLTQMGSGHFPEEGFGKACYMTDIMYVDNNGAEITPTANDLNPVVTASFCYDLDITGKDRLFVFYGGPGCKK